GGGGWRGKNALRSAGSAYIDAARLQSPLFPHRSRARAQARAQARARARARAGVVWSGRGRATRARPRPQVWRASGASVPRRSRVGPGLPRSVTGQAVAHPERSESGEHREGDGRREGSRVGAGAGEVATHGVVAARTVVAARAIVTGAGRRDGT